VSKRKSGAADDYAIREALRSELAREVGGKTRAQRIAEALVKKGEKGISAAVTEINNRLTGKPGTQQATRSLVDDVRPETWTKICSLAEQFGMPYEPCPRCGHVEHGKPHASVPTQQANADTGFQAFTPPARPKGPAVDDAEANKAVLMRQTTTSAEQAEAKRQEHEAGVLPKL
jgi:hypothetical protein